MIARRHREAAKTRRSTFACLREDQDRRHLAALVDGRHGLEHVTQHAIAALGRVVQLVSRLAIVTEVGKHPALGVERVGPVDLATRARQDEEIAPAERAAPERAEAALVRAVRDEFLERVRLEAPATRALVDRIDDERSRRELGKREPPLVGLAPEVHVHACCARRMGGLPDGHEGKLAARRSPARGSVTVAGPVPLKDRRTSPAGGARNFRDHP